MNLNDLPNRLQSEPEPEPPSDGEILSTLCQCFDAGPEEVLEWLRKFCPQHAYAEYLQDLGVTK